MQNFNSYWPTYKNLEEETIQLSKYINFSDDQLNVYSMYIADLIIKIVIEIEDLSKELYKKYDGPDVYDIDGNTRDLFFDTDCIAYLNTIFGICNRDIILSCTNFKFSSDDLKTIKPLKNANKRGTSSSIWNKAYQALKHDRRNNLAKGNIKNLIYALGALYILNIYNREDIEGPLIGNFDNRLGSSIFSVVYADATFVGIGEVRNDNAIDEKQRNKIPISTCIIRYTKKSWEEMHNELDKFNKDYIINMINSQEFKEKLSKKLTNNKDDLYNITNLIIKEIHPEYIRKHPPIHLGELISHGSKEVILNKGQVIYE